MPNTESTLTNIKAPTPFLRWAGGKRKLVPRLSGLFPSDFDSSSNTFFEPFVGGGSMMLALGDPAHPFFVPGSNLAINDMNPDLIDTYLSIRDEIESLIELLLELSKDVSKEEYLKIRAKIPQTPLERAARFIYLNRTCFNGLWRVNSRGQFNVPWGQLSNPQILDADNLRAVSSRLQGSTIDHLDFKDAVSRAKKNDLVYFDPPYIPLSSSASFSMYAKADFGIAQQMELADLIADLRKRDTKVVLSNSYTDMSLEIFGKVCNLYKIQVMRSISAKASSRGSVDEIIGLNYEFQGSLPEGVVKV